MLLTLTDQLSIRNVDWPSWRSR